jgi:hypothetical protein
MDCLGHLIDDGGIHADSNKMLHICGWCTPRNKHDVPALSVKYTDIAHDNEDDKTPKLSVQRIFAGLYSSTEKVRSANEYCTTNIQLRRVLKLNIELPRVSGGLIEAEY